MNDSRETDSVDLTEDQGDLFEALLEAKNVEARSRNSFKNSKLEGASSVIEELESIPQIETIFLESDEEDEIDDPIEVHDVETVQPHYKFLPEPVSTFSNQMPRPFSNISQKSPFRVREISEDEKDDPIEVHDVQTVQPHYKILPKPVSTFSNNMPPPVSYPFSNISQNSPFRVREISPSMLTSNMVENANAIALQDDTPSAAPKRYLIIPNDVLPMLRTSKGPISLNVPGIGSVVINKPFEMLKSNENCKLPPVKSNTVPAQSEVPVKQDTPKPYDALGDPKYQCWRYKKCIKRDLEGYSLSDRLGFYQAEQRRSKMCARRCNDNAKRLELAIDVLRAKLRKIPKLNMANVKLVEIDKIKRGAKKRTPEKNEKLTIKPKQKMLNPVQQKNLEILMSWKEHFKPPPPVSSSDSDNSKTANDLLLTKRVVVLNKANKRKYIKKEPSDIKQEIHSEPETKKKKKKLGRPRKIVDQKPKEEPEEEVITTISQRGRPRKFKLFDSVKPRRRTKKREMITQIKKESIKKEDSKIKPCYVKIPQLNLLKETIEQYRGYYKESSKPKPIDNLKQLQNKIDPGKPMLVINESQCSSLNLKQLCAKNNVVFPVSESTNLISLALSIGKCNVLFVKSDVFCQYISGARDAN